MRFLRQFNDPMVIILLVTATITGVLTALGSHMLPDTIVITGVVLLNSILGFVQEGKAEGALDALRNMMVQEAWWCGQWTSDEFRHGNSCLGTWSSWKVETRCRPTCASSKSAMCTSMSLL